LKYYLSNWDRYVGEIREDERELFKEKSSILKPFILDHYSYAHIWFEKYYRYQSRFDFDHTAVFREKKFENLLISKLGQYRRIYWGYIDLEKVVKRIIDLAKSDLTKSSQ